jgi:hypothetical protein
MSAGVVILTADELIAPDTEGWGQFRRGARETPTVTQILRAFLDHGGPILIEEIAGVRRFTLRDAAVTGCGGRRTTRFRGPLRSPSGPWPR